MIWLAILGCGDGVVSGDYPGEPLFHVSGTLALDESVLRLGRDYGVTVAWAGGEVVDTPKAFIDTTFPAFYELDLYYPPPDDTPAILEIDGVRVRGAAIFLYEDLDGDDVWNSDDEPFVGTSTPFVLTWQEEPWTTRGQDEQEVLVDVGYFPIRTTIQGCLDAAWEAPVNAFHILLGEKMLLPDLNCDDHLTEWAALHE